jgi:hypothetical protein
LAIIGVAKPCLLHRHVGRLRFGMPVLWPKLKREVVILNRAHQSRVPLELLPQFANPAVV